MEESFEEILVSNILFVAHEMGMEIDEVLEMDPIRFNIVMEWIKKYYEELGKYSRGALI